MEKEITIKVKIHTTGNFCGISCPFLTYKMGNSYCPNCSLFGDLYMNKSDGECCSYPVRHSRCAEKYDGKGD